MSDQQQPGIAVTDRMIRDGMAVLQASDDLEYSLTKIYRAMRAAAPTEDLPREVITLGPGDPHLHHAGALNIQQFRLDALGFAVDLLSDSATTEQVIRAAQAFTAYVLNGTVPPEENPGPPAEQSEDVR